MVIKCSCADSSEKINAERLIKRVDEIIEKLTSSPMRFSDKKATEIAVESWKHTKNMLERIRDLPNCE